jgi:hypothetical protein
MQKEEAMPANKSGISIITVDGKKYTERTFSEQDARKIPHIVVTAKGVRSKTVHGFRSASAMERWLGAEDFLDSYKQGKTLLRRVKRRLKPAEQKEISRLQARIVNAQTKRLKEALAKHGIKPNQTSKIERLLETYDPLTGPIIHSSIVYRHCGFSGSWRVIPSGWAFPDFRWMGFNDVASSVRTWGWLLLCQHTWYRGRRVWFVGYPYFSARCLAGWPYYFNDVASSGAAW